MEKIVYNSTAAILTERVEAAIKCWLEERQQRPDVAPTTLAIQVAPLYGLSYNTLLRHLHRKGLYTIKKRAQ